METKQAKNLLTKSYDIFSQRFLSFAVLAILFYVPFYIIFLYASQYITLKYPNDIIIYGATLPYYILLKEILLLILNIVFTPLFTVGVYYVSYKFVNSQPIDIVNIIKTIFKKSPFLILSYFIYYTGIIILSPVFLFLPYFITVFYFVPYEVASTTSNPLQAFANSKKLNRTKWFKSFVFIFSIFILNILCSSIFTSIYTLAKMPTNIIFLFTFNILISILNSYFYIIVSLWYINKKERAKGGHGFEEYL